KAHLTRLGEQTAQIVDSVWPPRHTEVSEVAIPFDTLAGVPLMHFHVGTSGYSYKEWKGSFYPEKLPAGEMLGYYGQRVSTVEINNTFYRMPKTSLLESWAEQVPPSFRFVLKAPQTITHRKRLKDAEESTRYLFETAAALKDKLGRVLFQLPPNLKKDLPRL